jgi:hypothetical protein
LYKLSTTISKSGAGSFSLLSTATAATGVYTVTSYADEAKTKALPTITLPDAFTDAKTIGCFQLKNVES